MKNYFLLLFIFFEKICFLMTVNVIGQRMNFLVIIHGCWLVAILVRRRRAAIARIWPRYCLFLSIFMIYQYLLCMGIPPALCIGESWCVVHYSNRILYCCKYMGSRPVLSNDSNDNPTLNRGGVLRLITYL